MSTPILNPNSSPSTNINPYATSPLSAMQIELGKILRQHDPNAIRLYDFLNHVKVFRYNSTELRWDNYSYIEGNLFAYAKQQITNNRRQTFFAFAVINRNQHFIQDITSNMSEQADQLKLFYEIVRPDKCEVFSLHFSNENECQRLHAFIRRSMSRAIDTSERQSTPVMNINSNTEDPTSSIKRMLNIPDGMDNASILPQQPSSLNLLPPSAFQTLPSDRDTHFNREQLGHVLFHLIQNNDQFLDMIYQTYQQMYQSP